MISMQTIRELLDRIHWDSEFSQGEFELGFLDHHCTEEVRIPLQRVIFLAGDHFFFYYTDTDGQQHSVPLHRIKSVYKNGQRIWHREH